jgi:hypothetical protein
MWARRGTKKEPRPSDPKDKPAYLTYSMVKGIKAITLAFFMDWVRRRW